MTPSDPDQAYMHNLLHGAQPQTVTAHAAEARPTPLPTEAQPTPLPAGLTIDNRVEEFLLLYYLWLDQHPSQLRLDQHPSQLRQLNQHPSQLRQLNQHPSQLRQLNQHPSQLRQLSPLTLPPGWSCTLPRSCLVCSPLSWSPGCAPATSRRPGC